MTPEVIHISVLGPIGFVAIGSMVVLLGEVLLSRSGSPYFATRSAQAMAITCSRMTSAMKVSLSLTFISGSRSASSLAATRSTWEALK